MQEVTRQALTEYLGHFKLSGDRRTAKTFGEIVRGITHAGSFLYELGVSLECGEVKVLARLG